MPHPTSRIIKTSLLALQLIVFTSVPGQADTDSTDVNLKAILLKSGATVWGTIIDSIPGKSLTVSQFDDGQIFKIKQKQVFCITNEDGYYEAAQMRLDSGYGPAARLSLYGSMQLTGFLDSEKSANALSADAGLLFSRVFSFGAHYRYRLGQAEGFSYGFRCRLFFKTSGHRPFVEANLARVNPQFRAIERYDGSYTQYSRNYWGGGAGAGCLFQLNNYIGLAVSVGLTTQDFSYDSGFRPSLRTGLVFLRFGN